LIAFYSGQPVVFVEHNIDDEAALGSRRSRWWRAAQADDPNKTSGTLPFVMTDSGYRYAEANSSGQYISMVNESLEVPAQLDIEAYQWRVGASQDLRVWGTVTNVSDTVYGWDNEAALNIIVYEEKQVQHIDNYVRMAIVAEIEVDLEPGGTMEFDHTIAVPGRPNFDKTHAIVLVDYRPVADGRFESLQAAIAETSDTPPSPLNDALDMATEIDGLPFTVTQTTVGSGSEPDEAPASCGRGDENSVWFSFTPDADVTLEVDTLGTDYDTILSVWTGDAHPLNEIACNDDDPNTGLVQSWLQVDLTAGTTYFVKVTGLNGAEGTLQLNAHDADVEPPDTPEPEPTDTPTPSFSSTIYMPIAKNRAE